MISQIIIFSFFKKKKVPKLFMKTINASYDPRVHGCILKMKYRVLSREFKSIETSPGFAQLLGEN